MSSIGIRTHPEQYVYVILDGTQDSPSVICKGICKAPNGASEPERLRWGRQDIQELLTKHSVNAAVIKTVEGNARTKDPKRLHLEGVIVEGIVAHGSQPETKIAVTSQIKAATGFTKLARYMSSTLLNNQALQSVSSGTYEDAALAALAGLPKT